MLMATRTGPTTIAPQTSYDTLSIAHAKVNRYARASTIPISAVA